MVLVCSVVSCKRKPSDGKGGTSFHKFPLDDSDRCQSWVAATGHDGAWQPTSYSLICSDHFHSSSFYVATNRRRLKPDAIPISSNYAESGKKVVGSWQSNPWKCQQCSATFPMSSQLAHHLAHCNPSESDPALEWKCKLSCPFCVDASEHYESISGLDQHLQSAHPNDSGHSNFTCQYCNSDFATFLSFIQHHLAFHEILIPIEKACSPTKEYQCGSCLEEFVTSGDLAKHIFTHANCQGVVKLQQVSEESMKSQNAVNTLLSESESCENVFDKKHPDCRMGMEYVTYECEFSQENQNSIQDDVSMQGGVAESVESTPCKVSSGRVKGKVKSISLASLMPSMSKDKRLSTTSNKSKLKEKSTKKEKTKDTTPEKAEEAVTETKEIDFDLYDLESMDLFETPLFVENEDGKSGHPDKGQDAAKSVQNGKTSTKKESQPPKSKRQPKSNEKENYVEGVPGAKHSRKVEEETIKSEVSAEIPDVALDKSKLVKRETLRDKLKRIRDFKKTKSENAETKEDLSTPPSKKPKLNVYKRANGSEEKPKNNKSMEIKPTRPSLKTDPNAEVNKTRMFTCPACCETFPTLAMRDKHFRQDHRGLKVFACQICGSSYDTYQAFRAHCVKSHPDEVDEAMYGETNDDEEDNMEFICDVCSLAFCREEVLTLHRDQEHGNGENPPKRKRGRPPGSRKIVPPAAAPTPTAAPGRSKFLKETIGSPSGENLGNNQLGLTAWQRLWLAYMGIKLSTLPDDRFPTSTLQLVTCQACKDVFSNEVELCIHLQRDHVDMDSEGDSAYDKALGCHKCYQLFLGPQAVPDIKAHMATVHKQPMEVAAAAEEISSLGESTPYACADCGAGFHRQRQWQWHVNGSSSSPQCSSTEKQCHTLPHASLLDASLFACPECSYIFAGDSAGQRLVEHMTVCGNVGPAESVKQTSVEKKVGESEEPQHPLRSAYNHKLQEISG